MSKLSDAFARWREAWNGDGDAETEACAVWVAMSGAAKDSLHQMLFAARPVWDGDHISKSGRDELIHAGLAVRVCHQGEQGYTSVTYPAYSIYKRVKGDEALRTGQLAAQARFRDLAAKTMRKRTHNAMSVWPWKRVKRLEVLLGDDPKQATPE